MSWGRFWAGCKTGRNKKKDGLGEAHPFWLLCLWLYKRSAPCINSLAVSDCLCDADESKDNQNNGGEGGKSGVEMENSRNKRSRNGYKHMRNTRAGMPCVEMMGTKKPEYKSKKNSNRFQTERGELGNGNQRRGAGFAEKRIIGRKTIFTEELSAFFTVHHKRCIAVLPAVCVMMTGGV